MSSTGTRWIGARRGRRTAATAPDLHGDAGGGPDEALVMSISFAALIAAQVAFMRMFGIGLTLAVLVDATLVRMLLVPAFMRVLGPRELVGTQTARPTAPTPSDQRGQHTTIIRDFRDSPPKAVA